jgi:hypothetical protein
MCDERDTRDSRLCNRLTSLCGCARIAVRRRAEVAETCAARGGRQSRPCPPAILSQGRPREALPQLAWVHLKAAEPASSRASHLYDELSGCRTVGIETHAKG